MGNSPSSVKGALAIANAKSQISKTFSDGDDKKERRHENPETKREMKQRHKEREKE